MRSSISKFKCDEHLGFPGNLDAEHMKELSADFMYLQRFFKIDNVFEIQRGAEDRMRSWTTDELHRSDATRSNQKLLGVGCKLLVDVDGCDAAQDGLGGFALPSRLPVLQGRDDFEVTNGNSQHLELIRSPGHSLNLDWV